MVDGVVALFGAPAVARLHNLVAMASVWRPDVVVHEVLEQAGSMLAARLGIPGVVHGIGPMFPFYAQLVGAAGAAIGEPELWAQLSTEQALDLCPPSLQPEGQRPWSTPVSRARRQVAQGVEVRLRWSGQCAIQPCAGRPTSRILFADGQR